MTYTQNQAIEIISGSVDRLVAEAERIKKFGLDKTSFGRVQFVILTLELRLNELRKVMQHEHRKSELIASFNGRSGRHDQTAQTVPG